MAAAQEQRPSVLVQSVDGEEYPSVSLGLTLPAELFAAAKKETPEFSVRENGRDVRVLSVESSVSERPPIDVVLVIDTSGSMSGRPMIDAKRAARDFIMSMGDADSIAVIGLGPRPVLVSGFTQDKAQLDRAVSGLSAVGETALYDALVAAARLMGTRDTSQQNVVLLSDGGDTVSGASLDDAVETMRNAGSAVHVVALESPEFNMAPLEVVAQGSGGRLMPVADSADLSGMFEGIAAELQNLFTVTFESRQPLTKDLELDVVVKAGDLEAAAETVIGNPALEGVGAVSDVGTDLRTEVKADPRFLFVSLILIFLATALFFTGLLLWFARGPNTLRQLDFYDQGPAGLNGEEATAHGDSIKARMLGAVDYVASKRGINLIMQQKLERAGLPLRSTEYIYFHVLSVVAIGLVALFLAGLPIAIMFILIASVLPIIFLDVAVERRKRAFEDQLPDILSLVAGSLRAGWGLLQAIEMVVREMGPPASEELKRVETEARLGLPVEEALWKMAERLNSNDFRWAVSAINIQRDVGGNLAEVLDIVAATMRDRAALRRHIRALTAEGRLSAVVLVALPFVELFLLLMINPEYMAPVFSSLFGVVLFTVGTILLLIGIVWLQRVIRVEV